MEPSKFMLPQMCCKCLGQAEETFVIGGEYGGYDRGTQTYKTRYYNLEAPICGQCSRGVTRMKIWGVTLLVVIPTAVWLLVRFFLPKGNLALGLNVGGIFLGICACAGLWDLSKPGKVTKKGIPLFENPQYQSKFEEANNIDPESYGIIDQLYKDLSKIPEDEKKLGKGN